MVVTQWLEVRRLLSGVDPNGRQQEMLELLNHLRTDPAGSLHYMVDSVSPLHSPDSDIQSALTYFGVSGSTLQAEWAALTPVAPLAWNIPLAVAAAHSRLMLQYGSQSHQLPGEASLGDRITTAGYTNWTALAENIYAHGESPLEATAAFAIDWGSGPGGMQSPRGHRENMMSVSYQDVGIGFIGNPNSINNIGPWLVTQDFGSRTSATATGHWLVGAVYNDSNGDGRYNAGEGTAGVKVHVVGLGTDLRVRTLTAGGYQISLPPGRYSVTFSQGGLLAPVTYQVRMRTANVLLDDRFQPAPPYVTAAGGQTQASPSTGSSYLANDMSIVSAAANSRDLPVGHGLIGGAGNDTMVGGERDDTIPLGESAGQLLA